VSAHRYRLDVTHSYRNGALKLATGPHEQQPLFHVAFLTRSIDPAYHIFSLARELARNKDRRLCYAATQDQYLAEADCVRESLFLDHHGQWQSSANLHPTVAFPKLPVRLPALSPLPLPI
jgi:hypothetical protein